MNQGRSGRRHVVQAGQSLVDIAALHGLPPSAVGDLVDANPDLPFEVQDSWRIPRLTEGDLLNLPDSWTVAMPLPAPVARRFLAPSTVLANLNVGGHVATTMNDCTLASGTLGDAQAAEASGGEQEVAEETGAAPSFFERHKTGLLLGIGASIVGALGLLAFLAARDKDGRTKNPLGDEEYDAADKYADPTTALVKSERARFRAIDAAFKKDVLPALQALKPLCKARGIEKYYEDTLEGADDGSVIYYKLHQILQDERLEAMTSQTGLVYELPRHLSEDEAVLKNYWNEKNIYEMMVNSIYSKSQYSKMFKAFADESKALIYNGNIDPLVMEMHDQVIVDVSDVSKMNVLEGDLVSLGKRGAWLGERIVPALRTLWKKRQELRLSVDHDTYEEKVTGQKAADERDRVAMKQVDSFNRKLVERLERTFGYKWTAVKGSDNYSTTNALDLSWIVACTLPSVTVTFRLTAIGKMPPTLVVLVDNELDYGKSAITEKTVSWPANEKEMAAFITEDADRRFRLGSMVHKATVGNRIIFATNARLLMEAAEKQAALLRNEDPTADRNIYRDGPRRWNLILHPGLSDETVASVFEALRKNPARAVVVKT